MLLKTIMKKYLILAAALCCPMTAMPAYSAPAKQSSSRQDAESLIVDTLSTFDEFVSLFENVNDKASADAAAVKLPMIVAELSELKTQMENVQPDAATEEYLESKYAGQFEAKMERLGVALLKLQDNLFYGSESLIYAVIHPQ